MAQKEKLDKIDDKAARKAKTSELNIDYFAAFIKELRKTTAVIFFALTDATDALLQSRGLVWTPTPRS